ncbi:hypothetical protein V6G10_004019 [Vibrio parahaemolyticus]|nr:hypothetical protein [Vibrio parahaemolyticus]MDG3384071.1 hypothetical protein [Vibrio parahaemolyticus]
MSIIRVPENRRYWLIRAGTNSGEFYEQFRANNVVAVGHANDVDFNFADGHELTDLEKERMIGSAGARLQERNPGKLGEVTRLKSQLRRFLFEVSVGDTIITLKESSQVVVGVVRSAPFYSNNNLYGRDGEKKVCDYNLRMGVEWGRPRRRDQVPLNLDRTLRIPHTITEFRDPHQVRTLNHWLYPIHFTGDEVRCSLRIASENDLSNRQITKLSQTLDTLEELSSFIEYASLNCIEINNVNFRQYIESGKVVYSIKTQHLFMSPGYNFIQVPGSAVKKALFAGLLTISFSGDGDLVDVPSNIDKYDVAQLLNEVLIASDIASVKNELKVSLPKQLPSGRTREEEMGMTLEDSSSDSDPIDGTML